MILTRRGFLGRREAYELGYRGFVGLECRPVGDPVDAAGAVVRADTW